MNFAFAAATLLGAASFVCTAYAQDVPTPPPAGVPARPRVVPMTPQPAEVPEQALPPAAAQSEALPQLPENPIKLEDEPDSDAASQPVEAAPLHQPTGVAAPVDPAPVVRKPVKPAGPVYYFAPDPYAYPANVMAPPEMHVPNSPDVEDLSVAGDHGRYTYYSYRRPWYTPGQQSANVTIVW